MGASKWWVFGGIIVLIVIPATKKYQHRHSSAGWNPVKPQFFVSGLKAQIAVLGFVEKRFFTILTLVDTFPA